MKDLDGEKIIELLAKSLNVKESDLRIALINLCEPPDMDY